MDSPDPSSLVVSARVMLVPIAFLSLLVMSSLLPEHHQSVAEASGVQLDGDPGPRGYIRAITDGGTVTGSGEYRDGSDSGPGRRTRTIAGGISRKKGVEKDVTDTEDGTDSVEDLLEKLDKGGVKINRTDKAGVVRNAEHEEEASATITHHETEKLGWVLDTEAMDVTTVPVLSGTKLRALDTYSSSPTTTETQEPVMILEFLTEQHHLILDLHPTRDLLAASYTEPGKKDGRLTVCEYQGKVRGVAGSWAALSVCDGVRGVLVGRGQELLVEPVQGASTLKEPHRVFSASLLRDSPGTCGVKKAFRNQNNSGHDLSSNSSSRDDHRGPGNISRRGRRGALQGGRLWTLPTTRFVELVLVADNSYFRKHGRLTRARCKAIVNIVNALYRPLGIVVVLTYLEVWEERDQVTVLHNHSDTLENLRPYRQKLLKERPHDNTVLLTEVDFEGSTVGYASVSGMCKEKESVAVVQDKNAEVGVVSQTLAHEMGHNLGMHHDEDEEDCVCETHSCLMSDTGSSYYEPNTGWSSCSKRDLVVNIDSLSFNCLKNVPTKMLPGSTCGDGVVDLEAGEQCDCGPPEYCDNSCCVADTCRLAANASCASGACCDTQTCQIEPGGIECRAARTICDLPEYCTGVDEYCPDDVHKRDGIYCREGEGRCHKGKCSSHEARCQQIWGHSAATANPRCFQRINRKGGSDGNCGFVNPRVTKLLPCAVGDTPCGTLQCRRAQSKEPKLVGQYSYRTQFFGNDSCSYIQATTYVPSSFWLSPEGVACGENKMCVRQRCVEVPAPDGDCLGGCSGRGVCNSRGHCHCQAGFAPPDCSGLGLGGSVDSGPMGRPRNVHVLLDVLFFLLLVLLAIFIIVFCLWDHLRGWWERGGRDSTLPFCATCMDVCCCPIMTKVTRWVLTDQEKNARDEVCQEEDEKDRILYQVDLDFKDSPSQTNTSGMASERIVTEVVRKTPKNSPDLRRKIQLPSDSSHPHYKSTGLDRPAYLQSISADSGCVDDFEDGPAKKPLSSQMSLTSLAGFFRTFEPRSSRKDSGRESRRSKKTSGSQRSMPLSRFVVDPLAGNRSSRQGTPPPDHMRAAFRRSITVDASSSVAVRPTGVPPPPPTKPKPYKSLNNLQDISELENSPPVHAKKRWNGSSNSGSKECIQFGGCSHSPSDASRDSASQPIKKPMLPSQNPLSRPKASPPRNQPSHLPSKDSTCGPRKTSASPHQKKSDAKGQTPAPKLGQTTSLKASQTAPKNMHSRAGQDGTGAAKTSTITEASPKKNVKDIAQKFEAKY